MEDIKEFEELVKPVKDFIINKYGHHATAIITDDLAKIVVDDISTPMKSNTTTDTKNK